MYQKYAQASVWHKFVGMIQHDPLPAAVWTEDDVKAVKQNMPARLAGVRLATTIHELENRSAEWCNGFNGTAAACVEAVRALLTPVQYGVPGCEKRLLDARKNLEALDLPVHVPGELQKLIKRVPKTEEIERALLAILKTREKVEWWQEVKAIALKLQEAMVDKENETDLKAEVTRLKTILGAIRKIEDDGNANAANVPPPSSMPLPSVLLPRDEVLEEEIEELRELSRQELDAHLKELALDLQEHEQMLKDIASAKTLDTCVKNYDISGHTIKRLLDTVRDDESFSTVKNFFNQYLDVYSDEGNDAVKEQTSASAGPSVMPDYASRAADLNVNALRTRVNRLSGFSELISELLAEGNPEEIDDDIAAATALLADDAAFSKKRLQDLRGLLEHLKRCAERDLHTQLLTIAQRHGVKPESDTLGDLAAAVYGQEQLSETAHLKEEVEPRSESGTKPEEGGSSKHKRMKKEAISVPENVQILQRFIRALDETLTQLLLVVKRA